MTKEEAIEEIRYYCQDSEKIIKILEQPPCDDCVSRQAVLAGINDWWGITSTAGEPSICDYIRELPSVTSTRKTGHWIGRKKIGFGEWEDVTVLVNPKGCVTDSVECSNCGNWLTGSDEYECDARYCPNCGSEMESADDSN